MHTKSVAVVFLLLLAGAEAARVAEHTQGNVLDTGAASKTPDLDWPGCGSKGLSCSSEGCQRSYLWLDTPRQSCRFTDQYKLTHRQEEFLQVELARLEEKSIKFAQTACIFGSGFSYDTYMWKCSRRMQQMIRLLRFLNKAIAEAKSDPEHPAHIYATSTEVQEKLTRALNNIGEGFDRYAAQSGYRFDFRKAYKSMLDLPERRAEAKTKCPNCTFTPGEERSQEEAYITAGMLSMVGPELSSEQLSELEAHIASEEQERGSAESEAEAERILDALDGDIARGNFAGIDTESLSLTMSAEQLSNFDMELEGQGLTESSSLLEQNGTSSQALSTRGQGPIKWIFTHGLGWVVTRIAWVVLYLIGVAAGVIRAAVFFPLLFLGCTLSKLLSWIFGDVIYRAGWDGDFKAVVQGFARIGTCPAWALDFVGFDSRNHVLNQVVLQPARFASDLTGVEHAYKSAKQLCDGIVCGTSAFCSAGKCYCQKGFYPIPGTSDCGPLMTKRGCVCRPQWEESKLIVFTEINYGCTHGRCKVDRNHHSYNRCKSALPRKTSWMGADGPHKYDECATQPFMAKLPPLSSYVGK
eukprot:TRINITY_DN14247_c0_g1_i2.p1 TRINITY_DN14247_c0_g1~~TRINITY_DN14247_c0_g1_i2.p1  ORF type:complete len:581 (+),score=106.83 TRINITY_DN14247_c0_g1_i2:70-1812(+)